MSILNIQWNNSTQNQELFYIAFVRNPKDTYKKLPLVNFEQLIEFIIEHKPTTIFIDSNRMKGEIIGKMLNFLVTEDFELMLYKNLDTEIDEDHDLILKTPEYQTKIELQKKKSY